MILVVAAILAAVIGLGVGQKLTDEIEQAVCAVADLGPCETSGDQDDDTGDPDVTPRDPELTAEERGQLLGDPKEAQGVLRSRELRRPAHVDDFDTRPNDPDGSNSDFGAVHTNSSIPSHAYYLMVGDIGRDAAEQIVYRAFTEKLESDSNFEDFRSAALEAAEEIYGADSPEYRGVDESFAEVGLDGTWEAPEIEGC